MLKEGEQNSAYFFRLEKYRSKTNSIHQININDAKLISDFSCKFYSDLYGSKYSEETTVPCLNSVKDLRTADLMDKNYCDTPFALEEMSNRLLYLRPTSLLVLMV